MPSGPLLASLEFQEIENSKADLQANVPTILCIIIFIQNVVQNNENIKCRYTKNTRVSHEFHQTIQSHDNKYLLDTHKKIFIITTNNKKSTTQYVCIRRLRSVYPTCHLI